MKNIWTRFFGSECTHDDTLVVRSVGVERRVCERCGNLSFTIAPTLTLLDNEISAEKELPRVAGL